MRSEKRKLIFLDVKIYGKGHLFIARDWHKKGKIWGPKLMSQLIDT